MVLPTGAVTTGWPSVRKKCGELGISFDPWQEGAGKAIFAKRADGIYAATVGGVVISIPRQVGKTFLLGSMVFALCLLHPRLTVIFTAHRLRTAGETFSVMQGMTRRKKIAPHISRVVLGSGEEEIQFRNGSRILFGARERGFGRGFAQVDVIVFDEAQILTDNAIDDMVPATNQAKHPAGALILMTGTPPKPTDPSEVFSMKRREALAGESEDTVYIEFSADPGARPDDHAQWRKANPSFPKRTPVEAMLRMRKNLTPDSFMREGLGIWDDDTSGDFFTPGKWGQGGDPESTIASTPVLGIAVSVDRSRATIGAAGLSPSGKLHLEPIKTDTGLGWVIDEALRLQESHSPAAFVMDGGGPGADLVEPLLDAGVKLTVMDLNDVKDACSLIFDTVENGGHAHLDDPDLNAAVKGAKRRDIGDRFAIGRRKSTNDVTPFEAVTFAAWGVSQQLDYDPLESIG